MALINRFQVTNMVGSTRSEAWAPRFVNEIYAFMGESSIIQMPNGLGKTRLSIAFNALLSRRRKLITELRESLSPSNSAAYSHVRVEFVSVNLSYGLLRMAGGAAVGEKHVFGFYGTNSKNVPLRFYHYAGVLEDLPVCKEESDGSIHISSQKKFDDLLANFPGTLHLNPKEDQWRRAVAEVIPLHIVERLARFQESGGGESKEAAIFQVKTKTGETFGEGFFWDVLAPELMVNPMEGFSSDSEEYYFEGTVLRSVYEPVKAQLEGEKQALALEQRREALRKLDPVVQAGRDLLQIRKSFAKGLGILETAMGAVKYVVEDSGLPGFPQFVPSGDQRVDLLVRHMVIDPDQGMLLRDRGLAELLGKQAKHINRDAAESRVPTVEIAQPTEIILDQMQQELEGRGRRPQYFTCSSVLRFLEKCSDAYLSAPREELKTVVANAFEHYAARVDSNPFRQRARRLEFDHDRVLAEIRQKQGEQVGLAQEIDVLQKGLDEHKENQGFYAEMARSGLFSAEELAEPLKTEIVTRTTQKEKCKAQEEHEVKRRELAVPCANYARFREAFGENVDPKGKNEEWLARQAENEAAIKHAENDLKAAVAKATVAGKELKDAQDRHKNYAREDQSLEERFLAAKLYIDAFPSLSPEGVAKKIREQKREETGKQGKLSTEVEHLQRRVAGLNSWWESHPGVEPKTFREEFYAKRDTLRDSKRGVDKELALVRTDIDHLRKRKVAPGELAQEGLRMAQENVGAKALHEYLTGLELPTDRLEKVLSLFSSVLFAPVVDAADKAETLLRLFEQKRQPIPVFLAGELGRFAAHGEILQTEASGLVHTYLAGRKSFNVECFLDPDKLKRELADAEARRRNLEGEAKALSDEIAKMSEDHVELKAAQAAQSVIDEKAQEVFDKTMLALEALTRDIALLEEKFPDEILTAAEAAEHFVRKGGQHRRDELRALLATAEQAITRATEDLQCGEGEKTTAENRRQAAQDREIAFLKETGEFQKILPDIIEYCEGNGPAFVSGAQALADSLKGEIRTLEFKLSHSFNRAQAYLQGLSIPEEERRRQLTAKQSCHGEVSRVLEALAQDERRLSERQGDAKSKATSYDHHIAGILPSYRALGGLLHDEAILGDMKSLLGQGESQDPFAPLPELVSKITEIMAALADIDVNAQVVLSGIGSIKGIIENDQDLKRRAAEVRSLGRQHDSAKSNYSKAGETIARDAHKGLSVEEMEHIRSLLPTPEKIFSFQETRAAKLAEGEEQCRKTQERVNALYDESRKVLARLADDSRFALKTLKGILAKSKNATFEIDVEIVNDLESVMSRLANEVKRKQIALSMEQDMDLFGLSTEEEEHRKNVLQKIRHELYRGIFLKPRIRVYFPQIRREKVLFSDKFSTGERMALSLLWLCILAEYSISMAATSRFSQLRPGKLDTGPSLFWIDGMFSHLSHVKILRDALQLKGSRGGFQLIGLMHDPARLLHHDFSAFPRLFVTLEQVSRDKATPREWATTEVFKEGQVDSLLAYLDHGSISEPRRSA